MRKILIALVASVTALLLTSTAAPAGAEPAERALPVREITIDGDSNDTSLPLRYKIFGKAQAWKFKKVALQKKKGKKWVTVAKDKTNKKKKYKFWVSLKKTGKTKWRVKVPQGNGYRLSYSPVLVVTVY